MNVPDKLKAIHKAKEIIDVLNIEDASYIDIEAIAMTRNVVVTEGPLEGADGRLSVFGDKGLVTVRENIKEPSKKRFIGAHELGHFELHREKTLNISCTEDDFYKWTKGNPIESEANYFASELLMPEVLFDSKIRGKDINLSLLQTLSTEFNTSITATSIRFVTLRPEYALICSEASIIKWFVINSEIFPYFINTRGKVHQDSLAYDYFHSLDLPTKLFPVEPSAWVEDNYSIKGVLKELAIPLGRKYNQVLSFLYVEEDWDD